MSRRAVVLLLLLSLALLATPPAAADDGLFLVRDIDPSGELRVYCYPYVFPGGDGPPVEICSNYLGSQVSQLTALGERVVFVADDAVHGPEPWVSDGTEAGTVLLADVCPGDCGSEPVILGRAGDRLLFWADDGVGGAELWRTDGTPAGTGRLPAICPGPCDAAPSLPGWRRPAPLLPAAEAAGKLVFVAQDPVAGEEPWVSDGTPSGTRRLADLVPGANVYGPRSIRVAGGDVFISGHEAIWRTTVDGEGGKVERIFEPPERVRVPVGIPFGEGLLWMGMDEDGVTDLWMLGGEQAGQPVARKLHTFPPSAGWVVPVALDRSGLYLLVNGDDANATEPVAPLWHTDGTVSGTRRIGGLAGVRGFATGFGSEHATDWSSQSQPWRGGFLVRGTGVLGQIQTSGYWFLDPAAGKLEPVNDALQGDVALVARGRVLVAGGRRPVTGSATDLVEFLLHSDGTVRGTETISRQSLVPDGYQLQGAPEIARAGDLLFVSRDTREEGRELWALRLSEVDSEEAFLQDGLYRVRVRFTDHRNGGGERDAKALPLRDGSSRFWFFRPDNPEVVVKVLDGGGVNGKAWVFHGGTTDLAYDVEVRSVLPGVGRRTYSRPAGDLCGAFDTSAFDASTARNGSAVSKPSPATATTPASGCGGDVLCLGEDGRFRVRVRFRNQYAGGAEGSGRAVSDDGDRSGWFWFFSPHNLEVMVKVLDGRPVNGHHWVLWGGLTTLEYDLEVTDTTTDTVRTYHHDPGDLCGGADVAAF